MNIYNLFKKIQAKADMILQVCNNDNLILVVTKPMIVDGHYAFKGDLYVAHKSQPQTVLGFHLMLENIEKEVIQSMLDQESFMNNLEKLEPDSDLFIEVKRIINDIYEK